MKTPRIDEIINKIVEVGKQRADMFEPSAEVILATTAKEQMLKVHQAGFDEAVEVERNRIKEWVQTQVNDGGGQCIHYEEILEALQNNK